jgi:hypothetical protein
MVELVRTTQQMTQSVLVLRAVLERKNQDCLHTLREKNGERRGCGKHIKERGQ